MLKIKRKSILIPPQDTGINLNEINESKSNLKKNPSHYTKSINVQVHYI